MGSHQIRTLVEDELNSGDVQVEDVLNVSRPDECFSFVWDGLNVYEWESDCADSRTLTNDGLSVISKVFSAQLLQASVNCFHWSVLLLDTL